MREIRFIKYIFKAISILLFCSFPFDVLSQKSDEVILYAKLKSSDTPILQPWSSTFLSDRDYPATMLNPISFHHVIPKKENVYTVFQIFRRERPDILEIHLPATIDPKIELEKLRQHPLVEYAEVDTYVEDLQNSPPKYTPNDPEIGKQYAIEIHNMEQAWAINKGSQDVVIGIHDSGFEVNHEDLKGNLKVNEAEINGLPGIDDDNNGYIDDFYGYNFTNNSNDLTGSTHGTQVAGSASATSDNNIGITGMGFNTKMLFSVRSNLSSLVYLCENGASIINMSWGSPFSKSTAYQEVINYYTEDAEYDILFIAAAGNNNHSDIPTDYYPASFDNVLSVSAINENKNNQNYTKSYKIQVVANDNSLTTYTNNSYKHSGGTSIAAPAVAGIASLVRSQFPELTSTQVAELIRYTSDTTFYSIGNNADDKYKFGFGIVDAYSALTSKDDVHIVKAQNLTYGKVNTGEIDIVQGDTIALWFDFKNLFNGNTSLYAVIESYNNSYIPIKDTTYIGQLNEGQLISNQSKPFLIKVAQNANLKENVHFRVNLIDSTSNYVYKDWHNVEMNITLEQYINFNKISGIFRPDGTIGKDHGLNYYTSNQSGITQFYHLTRQAGLIIATKEHVSDATYTDIYTNHRNADFHGITPINYLYDYTKDFVFPVIAYDMKFVDTNSTDPINLEIHQTYFSSHVSTVNKEFFTELEIKNISNSYIDTLYAGLFIDWMMDYTVVTSSNYPTDSSIVSYDADKKIVIVKHLNENKYAALTLLNDGIINVQAIDNLDGNNSDINITDGFSEDDKRKAVSSGIGTTTVGSIPTGTNSSSVLSLTIPHLNANEIARIGFLVTAADSLEQLYQQIDSIQTLVNYWLKGPSPEIPYQIAHEGEYVPIRTENFDSLALFKEENGIKVLKDKGRLFDVLIDSINYYFVQSQGRYVYHGDTVQLQGEAIPELQITSPQYACKSSNVIIQPQGCSIFNYYKDELLTELLYTGQSLTLYDITSDTSFYITCAERTAGNIEYIYAKVIIDSVFTDYYISDSISYVGDSISAAFQDNTGAISWQWYLDGEQYENDNESSVNITFEESGIAQLRLFSTNRAGCTYIISKEIIIKNDHTTSSMVSVLEHSKIYPNPIKDDKVNLTLSHNLGMMNFELYDYDGRLIQNKLPYTINNSTYLIYLPRNLSNKMYLLKGASQYGSRTWQILIR